jgi:hypothetical protein
VNIEEVNFMFKKIESCRFYVIFCYLVAFTAPGEIVQGITGQAEYCKITDIVMACLILFLISRKKLCRIIPGIKRILYLDSLLSADHGKDDGGFNKVVTNRTEF